MRLEEKVAQSLIACKKTLSIAESCTGGLISYRLTDIPGSSAFLKLGLVVYSNQAKTALLGVPAKDIRRHGVVSEKIALAMARQVRRLLKTDFGISVTGIAGPAGGTKTKPVGLVYMAVSTDTKTLCLKCRFKGSRRSVRQQAASQALKLLLEFLV
ncbi:MAG TPA: CinA family protein [Candidatus Omnitrophota bacterium]|nr:CinA family protein [Candidatus Omnitrophota bacterium]